MKNTLLIAAACLLVCPLKAQVVELNPDQYDQMKAAGTLPAEFIFNYPVFPPAKVQPGHSAERAGGSCDCWVEPDSTYTLAMEPNDDMSSTVINLPFNFNLYGSIYDKCYINNNGNVSFLLPHSTFSAYGFPTPSFRMVAPFWGDVDTRGVGTVEYKVTPNALYVNWIGVGYYASQTDKLNTFQLIISDGTNTDVGLGSNVSFCYKDMQWTTGSASCQWDPVTGYNCNNGMGTYTCTPSEPHELGFCGVPATVGANRGDGIDFVQFGRFNMPGMAYDGPFGNPDEVWWLSHKNFVFSTAVSSSNIAPVASGSSLCDTIFLCAGEPVVLDVDFLSPENGQTTVAGYSISPPMAAAITAVNAGPGNPTNIHLAFTPTMADSGTYVITYTATDDGVPPLTSTVTAVLQVAPSPTEIPVITGEALVCHGELTELSASGNYPNYQWSNGQVGQSILVGPGTYSVGGGSVGCVLVSDNFTVQEAPLPEPVVDGILFNCGGLPALLATTLPYSSYAWSNGETGPTVSVGTGTYSVTVMNEYGCSGTSPAVNVLSANSPIAFFDGEPPGEVFPGTTVAYTDQSDDNGAVITSWAWDAGGMGSGSGTTFTLTFDEPGAYPITLTVTTSDGCSNTYTYLQIVLPEEIIFPNVFTPNGDGHNDALVFEGAQFYPNTSLQVLNRWGQPIYTSSNYKNTWRPSKEIPEGTYFYILKLFNGKEYTGHVTLLR